MVPQSDSENLNEFWKKNEINPNETDPTKLFTELTSSQY